jgi:hypothetical protein
LLEGSHGICHHRRLSSRRGRRRLRRGHPRRLRRRAVDRFRPLTRILAPCFRSATSAPFALSVPAGVAKHVRMGLDLLALTSSEAAEPRRGPACRSQIRRRGLRCSGSECKPRILGIGADSGHQEHRSPRHRRRSRLSLPSEVQRKNERQGCRRRIQMYHKRRRAGFKRLQRGFRIRCPLTERLQLLSSSRGAKRRPPVACSVQSYRRSQLSDSRRRFERRTKTPSWQAAMFDRASYCNEEEDLPQGNRI